MIKAIFFVAAFAFQFILCDVASAADQAQDDPASADTQSQKPKRINMGLRLPGRSLESEWAPSRDTPLTVYRQNYALVTKTFDPNNAPTSPNPVNQVPFTYPLDYKELNFQFSVKSSWHQFGEYTVLWFAYTQNSFWQFFDTQHSRPFRDNNYEPEFILSHRFVEGQNTFAPLPSLKLINLSQLHQSNGQSDPRSRSWNRFYVQAGFEHNFGGDKLLILPRYWWRDFKETTPTDDNNPDILSYMGHGDIEFRYYQNTTMSIYTLMLRSKATQLDFAYPLKYLDNANIHLRYFTGYGESLIDYNQKHHTVGVGISLPY